MTDSIYLFSFGKYKAGNIKFWMALVFKVDLT